MTTLEVNGEAFEVVGDYRFATAKIMETPLGGGASRMSHVACFIAATIRIPATHGSVFDPPSDVRLLLDHGRVIKGDGLVDTADGTVRGDTRYVRFEGGVVEE